MAITVYSTVVENNDITFQYDEVVTVSSGSYDINGTIITSKEIEMIDASPDVSNLSITSPGFIIFKDINGTTGAYHIYTSGNTAEIDWANITNTPSTSDNVDLKVGTWLFTSTSDNTHIKSFTTQSGTFFKIADDVDIYVDTFCAISGTHTIETSYTGVLHCYSKSTHVKMLPFNNLLEQMSLYGSATNCIWRQRGTYTADDLGSDSSTTDASEVDTNILCSIQPIREDSSDLVRKGFTMEGDAVAYLQYGIQDADYDLIEVKDEIVDENGENWSIEEISRWGRWYLKLLLRRVD